MIPTREDCFRLMGQYGMFDHIIDHSIQVAKVALFLSVELNRRGQRINPHLVEAAALLHDLTKTECLKTREDHALTGSKLLGGMGYERVGEVVAEHIQLLKEKDPSWVSEEEVVNYADKRVRHDRIVSLKERFEDLMERYGKSQRAFEMLEGLRKTTFDIEKKIFSVLEFDPDHLEALSFEAGHRFEGSIDENKSFIRDDDKEAEFLK
ncbi:MAG: HDIG domain-containing protein [Thermodesulfobacteriota bacterium]|nr:HDIG domain-containing protein [Thermodesulfobacteriota bacterium]